MSSILSRKLRRAVGFLRLGLVVLGDGVSAREAVAAAVCGVDRVVVGRPVLVNDLLTAAAAVELVGDRAVVSPSRLPGRKRDRRSGRRWTR